jgi:hypothetical protein
MFDGLFYWKNEEHGMATEGDKAIIRETAREITDQLRKDIKADLVELKADLKGYVNDSIKEHSLQCKNHTYNWIFTTMISVLVTLVVMYLKTKLF